MDGPFIAEGNGVLNVFKPGPYLSSEIPKEDERKPERVSLEISGDSYVLGKDTKIRIVKIGEVWISEISKNGDSNSVILAKVIMHDNVVDICPVDSEKYQDLLIAKANVWKTKKSNRPQIIKDAKPELVLSGTQDEKLQVVNEIVKDHMGIFSGKEMIRLSEDKDGLTNR